MGFETELLFNEIELAPGALGPLRESAMKSLSDRNCSCSYDGYVDLYVESSDYRTINLEISESLGGELKKLLGTRPVPWSKLKVHNPQSDGEEDSDDITYRLAWYPYDGYSGKWYHVGEFVAWVSAFCASGQLFQLTQEDGGGLWGWEFDGGMFRELELRSKGRWRRSKPAKTD